jgi:uncharacterized protein YjbI with pentapeptide repeats
MPRDYTGKTLRGRYFKPEDDLKGANFTRATLRGINFNNLDLTGAIFVEADIRGTHFTNAILQGVDFTRAKAGLQKSWALSQFFVAIVLSIMLNFMAVFVNCSFLNFLFKSQLSQGFTISPGKVAIMMILIAFLMLFRDGVNFESLIKIVLGIIFSMLLAVALAGSSIIAVMGVVAALMPVVFFSLPAIGVAIAITFTDVVMGEVAVMLAGMITVTAVIVIDANFVSPGAFIISPAVVFLSSYMGWQACKGNEKFSLIRSFGIIFGSVGGTSFRGADLTSANFTDATLKSTNFSPSQKKQTTLANTCWLRAKRLDRAITDSSILSDSAVCDLLVTGNGRNKSYIGANLYSAYLNGANLEGANLEGANLSHATLQQAHLKDTNLTKVLATGADFTDVYLTGACLESWTTDHTTILENIDCQFVFLLKKTNTLGSRERCPHDPNRVFEKGDFEKLHRKIRDTVQLLLRDGINPEAFTTAFQKLMAENPDITCDSILSIERKDADVLITIKVSADSDKAKVEQQFMDPYQASLEALKNAALLESEQRHNQDLKELALKQAENFNISQLLSNFTIIAGDRTIMTDNKNQGITAGDGSFINTGPQTLSNSLINLSGNVSDALNRLADSDPSQAKLKFLLAQLITAIETDPDLPAPDKNDALEQVGILATLGSNLQQPDQSGLGRKAIKILKGTVAMLPSTATLVKAIRELLPAITKLMGF